MAGLTALSEETLMELNEDLNDYNNFPERDGVVLPEDLYGAWESEELADIDILAGTNRDETRYWIREMGLEFPILPDVLVYKLSLPFMYENDLKELSPEETAFVESFMKKQTGSKIWKITELYNELIFRIPAVEQLTRHKGKNYNYYWIMPCADDTLGACHAVELAYVFNNPQADLYTDGLYNEKLADTVQDMWVNFARTGDPGTEEYAWEPYTRSSRKTMVLGEEIGMTNTKFRNADQMKDPVTHFIFDMTKGMHIPDRVSFRMMRNAVRDNARTPMQWDASANAGFNMGARPWQCVNPDYKKINVEADLAADKSIYRFYQELLALRKSEETLIYGNTIEYYPDDRQVISYSRCYGDKRFLIVGNFSGTRGDFIMPGDFELDELTIRMTNRGRTDAEVEEIMHMKPYEAILFEEQQR